MTDPNGNHTGAHDAPSGANAAPSGANAAPSGANDASSGANDPPGGRPLTGADLVVTGIGQLVTCAGDRAEGAEAALGIVENAALVSSGGKVIWTGPEADLPPVEGEPQRLDVAGLLVTPGFVEPHTHACFDGDRSGEFAERCAGVPYLEILKRGGGILATVRATRAATQERLTMLTADRLRRFLRQGVTTVEVKSGYGLTLEDELKMLRAAGDAAARVPVTVVPTLLGAHAVPPELTRERYVDLVCEEMIPAAAEAGLARFADAFVEQGAFTPDDARRIAAAAREHGLGLRLHVDQLTAGHGAELAAELGAAGADHLEQIGEDGIRALAEAGVCAGLLPTSTLYMRMTGYAPGRALADAGVVLALATNLNPGSAMTESHSLALGLACLWNGLTPAEALLAATDGAARSLDMRGAVGVLAPGARADLVVHRATDYRHLAWHFAASHAEVVVAGGRIVHEAGGPLAACLG